MDYEVAYKSPLKFYDSVMSQDITQHKVQKSKEPEHQKRRFVPLELTSRITKRAIGRILFAVQDKLYDLLREQMAEEHGEEWVEQAMRDRSVKEVVQAHIATKGI